MKNPLTLAGIEPATFQFVAQHSTLQYMIQILKGRRNKIGANVRYSRREKQGSHYKQKLTSFPSNKSGRCHFLTNGGAQHCYFSLHIPVKTLVLIAMQSFIHFLNFLCCFLLVGTEGVTVLELPYIPACTIFRQKTPPFQTAVAQWLRCCATNRKVAGSIPDGVIGVFR